jgi:hypothetical protein
MDGETPPGLSRKKQIFAAVARPDVSVVIGVLAVQMLLLKLHLGGVWTRAVRAAPRSRSTPLSTADKPWPRLGPALAPPRPRLSPLYRDRVG